MLFILLCLIMSALCGAVGLLGATLVGHTILRLFGVSNERFRAWKLAALAFGLPAMLAGGAFGYWIGTTLVEPTDPPQPAVPATFPTALPPASRPAGGPAATAPAMAPATTPAR
ncbi:MAG TPA: hypothetical protein VF796_27800 [Humisphaera sp.]